MRQERKRQSLGAKRIAVGLATLLTVLLAAAALPWPASGPASAGEMTLLGDTNCDGSVNAIDAAVVLQLDAGLLDALPCQQYPDVNCDSRIDALDASLILQFTAGFIESLPISSPMGASPH